MINHLPRYSKEDFAKRGTEIYDRDIRPQIEQSSRGKIVAIDIETGDFEIADDTLSAYDRLSVRQPDAQIWFVRVGYQGVHRIGPRVLVEANGKLRRIEVDAAETAPLVGMALLYGHKLTICAVDGGAVSIDDLEPIV